MFCHHLDDVARQRTAIHGNPINFANFWAQSLVVGVGLVGRRGTARDGAGRRARRRRCTSAGGELIDRRDGMARPVPRPETRMLRVVSSQRCHPMDH